MTDGDGRSPEERARKRATDLIGLIWHIVAFVVVNGFLWTLDIVTGGGLEWAYWVSIAWGIGVVFHVAAYLLEESGFQGRTYQRFLEQERRRDEGR